MSMDSVGVTDDIFGEPPVTEPPVDNVQPEQPVNPAWQEILSVLPDSLHSLVQPALTKWEGATQAKFTKLAEDAKVYEPYKQYVEGKVPPEQIAQALALTQFLDSNPQEFMKQMQGFLGEQQPQQPQTQSTAQPDADYLLEEPFDLEKDPRFQQIKSQQDIIAGFLADNMQKEQAAAADKQLAADLDALKQKHGEFDEGYVLALAAQGMPLDKAVGHYNEVVTKIRTTPRSDANLPNILTPGGGTPAERIDPANFTPQQRKDFIIAQLRAAAEAG